MKTKKEKKQEVERIPIGKEGKLIIETNNDGETFKVTLGKEQTEITSAELRGFFFLFADKKEKEDLITAREIKMKLISRLLKLRLDKDMKAGEIVVAHYSYPLPAEYADKLVKISPEKYKHASITLEEAKQLYPEILL